METVRAEGGAGPPGVAEPSSAELPPRAHAVIAGRLAQLSDHAREIAAAAAVIGRAFDLEVLVRLVGDEEVVVRALDELWRKRIVREQGPNAYDFTHDKLREVAYGETSAPQRRRLHRRVAEDLVAHETDLDPKSAQIAAHYESAGLPEQAIPHYSRAAVVAQGVYAHDEAMALVHRGLSQLRQLSPSARRDSAELDLLLVLAPSYRIIMGWAAPALGGVLDRALALCDRVGTGAQRAQILYGMQSLYIVAGRLEKSALITDEMVRVLRETQDSEPPRAAFAMMAGVRVQIGHFQEACLDFDGLVRDADKGQLRRLQESQGLDYEVLARAWQSHAHWCLGRPDTAFLGASHALRLARQLKQPFTQAIAATYLALLQQLRADPASFRQQAEEALELATEFKATYYRAWAAILVAYAQTLGRPDERGPRPSAEHDRELQGDGGPTPLAVLPRPAGGRPPPEGRVGSRPRHRGGGPGPRSRDERALVGRGAPSAARGAAPGERRGRGGGGSGASARPRDRPGTAGEVPRAARRPGPGRPLGWLRPDRPGSGSACACLCVVHGRPGHPRPGRRPRVAVQPRLRTAAPSPPPKGRRALVLPLRLAARVFSWRSSHL